MTNGNLERCHTWKLPLQPTPVGSKLVKQVTQPAKGRSDPVV